MPKPDEPDPDLDGLIDRAFTPVEKPEERGLPKTPGLPSAVSVPSAPPITRRDLASALPGRARPGVSRGGASLAEALTIGVLLTDAGGVVRNANSSARRILGVLEGTLEGARLVDLFEAADRNTIALLLDDAFHARPPREIDLAAVTPKGSVPVRVTCVGRFDDEKRLREVLFTIRESGPRDPAVDVSIHGGKIEALAELGVELGREVGPLVVRVNDALLTVRQLLDEGGLDIPRPERELLGAKLSESTSALLRLQEVVSELERFAIEEPLKIEPIDPGAILKRAETLLSRSLKSKRVRVVNDMDEPAPVVLADASRLTEIFVNLLRNARNAIQRRADAEDPELTSSLKRLVVVESFVKSSYVCLLVTNTGVAIPPEDAEKIFLPSFAAKDPKRIGLSLPATAALLKEMGGAIRCQPLGTVGTRFVLMLRHGA